MMTLFAAIIFSLGLYYGHIPPAHRITENTEQPSRIKNFFYRVRDGPAAKLGTHPQEHAGDIELFSACLMAGLGAQGAATAVATASQNPSWGRTARLLALGIDAERAWAELASIPALAELAHMASCSGRSGAALTEACQRIATEHREQAKEEATAQAERAGVLIALPMTLCYLPAFFLLGLVPVLVGMGSNFFNI